MSPVRPPQLGIEGYAICPDVFSAADVARLRREVGSILDVRGVSKTGGTVLSNAAAEAPDLGWVFCHQGVLAAVRRVTGIGELTFTMEADLHRNYAASHWHKDSGEQVMPGGYFDCDAFSSPECRVFKVALYLQDHHGYTGLHVRPGSMATPRLDLGADVEVEARAGDAVIFDVRITHRGIRPPLPERIVTHIGDRLGGRATRVAAGLRQEKNRILGRPDRLAVYFAFGVANARSIVFAQRNMTRQISHLPHGSPGLTPALVEAFEQADVQVVPL